MAPEHEARPRADFYDHESETPRRRRRPAADWGVGEDIFDRMPSRRFSRADRRAEHHELVVRRGAEPRREPAGPRRDAAAWGDAWSDDPSERAHTGGPRRDAAGWGDDASEHGARATESRRDAAAWGDEAWADEPPRRRGAELRREVESWGDAEAWAAADELARRRAAGSRGDADAWAEEADLREPAAGSRAGVAASRHEAPEGPVVDSWMDERRLVPGESRTIVLGADGAPEAAAAVEPVAQRRTVKISGHPDRLPVPRTQRPPRTAVERIGASPDRIVAYAVALGFLLVLIAVLTTGR